MATTIRSIEKFVSGLVDAPELFLTPDASRRRAIEGLTRRLYKEVLSTAEKSGLNHLLQDAMPELMTQGFDTEQIWEQIQLVNAPLASQFNDVEEEAADEEKEEEDIDEDMDEDGQVFEGPEPRPESSQDASGSRDRGGTSAEEDDDQDEDESGFDQLQSKNEIEHTKQSPAEEKEIIYLNEEELDEFVDFDYRDGFQTIGNARLDEDDDVDMNAPIDDGPNDFKYDDFFDKPDLNKKFEVDDEKYDPQEGEEEFGELSRYEREKLMMQKSIKDIEGKIVQPREWVMSGEVAATHRPENSLLEKDLDFQMAQRLPEPVTEETTMELEDMIKQRIINEIWDDPERKEAPKEKKFKPKQELSQEKSSLGLAELYEKEYVAKAMGQEEGHEVQEALKEKHKEIAVMFAELNHKLDALSNFHFTPMPYVEEMKVTSKAPAISMEEVIPMGVSNEAATAPQEEFRSKSMGMPTERSEMSQKERQTRRNTKKKRLRKRIKSKQQNDKKEAHTNSKKAMELNLRKARDSNLVKTGEEVDRTDYTKSSVVFAKIDAEARGETQVPRKKKRKKGNKAANVKL
ncbi:hypothetical protein AAMO2058_000005200 [Amorphochlora amoebiformis]|mmetsp:Transcript_34900/g.56305  ORF Transcript_34900/g.56305 Transcript_34900/m.56305 type:complete len:573 (-) Transcript_34900:61-1779(-)